MRRRFLGVVVGVALLAGACGDDDESADVGDTTTTTTADAAATTTTTAVGTTTTTVAPDAGGGDDVDLDPSVAPADLTSEEICRRLPGDVAATALGVGDVTASPGSSATPQCSYRFTTADGDDTDATVAALRTEADLSGRFGDDAYAFVVDLNKAAAQDAVTETPLAIGTRAVLLTGERLFMAVVQLGGRIVTVLLNTDAGDAAAVSGLAEAAAGVLAP